MDIPVGAAHHTVLATAHGQTARATHHRDDYCRCHHWRTRTEHTGTRQQLRAVWRGGPVLHHVPCRPGDEPQRPEGKQVQGAGTGTAVLQHTDSHRLRHKHRSAAVWHSDVDTAGKYVRIEHTGVLPHRAEVRTVAPTQREHSRRRYCRDRHTDTVGAGCREWYVQRRYGRRLLGVACGEGDRAVVCHHRAVPTAVALVLPSL